MILYHIYYTFMPSITYIWTTFVKATLSKSIIFKVKSTFETNVLKWVIKTIFINSNPFSLLIIKIKILFTFQKEWCTFGRKKDVWKKQGLSILKVWVFWICKNIFDLCQTLSIWTLQLMENIPKTFMTIQTIMIPLWSFKHTKMQF